MGSFDTFPAIATVAYTLFNAIALPIVCLVTHKTIIEYQKSKKKQDASLLLYLVSLGFYMITFSTIFGLLFMAAFKVQSIKDNNPRTNNPIYTQYHSIFVLFYGKQNCLMLLILYLKLRKIFSKTPFRISPISNKFFMTCFTIAIIVFIFVPIMHSIYPSISIWRICSSTFCFYNVAFMTVISGLFINKLYSTFKAAVADDNKTFQSDLIFVITKLSILAGISIVCTMSSCFFLIIRYAMMFDNVYINNIGDWIISIDIYSNFLFITLTMKYYDKWYLKLFGCLHDVIAARMEMRETMREMNEMVMVPNISEKNSTTDICASPTASSKLEIVQHDKSKQMTEVVYASGSDSDIP